MKETTTYQDCYKLLEPEDKQLLDELLERWKKVPIDGTSDDHHVVNNLINEHLLGINDMKELLTELIRQYKELKLSHPGNTESDTIEITETIKTLIKQNMYYIYEENGTSFQLRGGEVAEDKQPHVVGTAAPKKLYYRFLRRQKPKSFLFKFEDWINQVIDNPVDYRERDDYKDLMIKKSHLLVWLAWCEKHGHSPLEGCGCQFKEDVCNILGLGMEEYVTAKEILFFEFENKAHFKIYKPTFCDSGFNRFFRPTDLGEDAHGRTFPLDRSNGIHGVPEGVMRSTQLRFNALKKVETFVSKQSN